MEKNFSPRALTVAELVAEAIESAGAVKHLKAAIIEYYENTRSMTEKLKAAEETLKFVRTQRDEYERQVWDFKNALINRDHEFNEVKKMLAEAEEENDRQGQLMSLALIKLNSLPKKPTNKDFRKCLNGARNALLGI